MPRKQKTDISFKTGDIVFDTVIAKNFNRFGYLVLDILKRSTISINMNVDRIKTKLSKMKNNLSIYVTNNITDINNDFKNVVPNIVLNRNNLSVTNFTKNVGMGLTYIYFVCKDNLKIFYDILCGKTELDVIEEPIVPKKYALIHAISDYLYINDLSYCDEDAVEWCNYLSSLNYQIVLLGDRTSTYGKWTKTDLATEANTKKWMKNISDMIVSGDQFVFISSGHGSGDGKGKSWICCLDENFVEEGELKDSELKTCIKQFTDKNATVILFFDNCFSGGLIPEVVSINEATVCAVSTCTENGYGFDVDQYKHGAWTYHFLILGLLKNPNLSINDIYTKSVRSYPFKQGNTPCLGGNGSLKF